MTVVALDDKLSSETREALRFLRENDPTGSFSFVARAILQAHEVGASMGHNHVEFLIESLAHALDTVRPLKQQADIVPFIKQESFQ